MIQRIIKPTAAISVLFLADLQNNENLFKGAWGLAPANGKMRACGDVGLQFRVSRVRVRGKVRVSVKDRVGV